MRFILLTNKLDKDVGFLRSYFYIFGAFLCLITLSMRVHGDHYYVIRLRRNWCQIKSVKKHSVLMIISSHFFCKMLFVANGIESL